MTTYYIWRRHSNHAWLDGFIGWSVYPPQNDGVCAFTVLHEITDVDEARHLVLTERGINDVAEHKRKNCTICWTTDPSMI